MSRLINADLPREQMEKLLAHHLMMSNFSADRATSDCIAFLDLAPTVDAVPVVRCKDCLASSADGWVCCGSGMMPEHGTFPHLFCSDGKRKDGDA